MITINLIPEEIKKNIAQKNNYLFLAKFLIILSFIVLTADISLIAAKKIINENDSEGRISILEKNNQAYKKMVNEINFKVGYVADIQQSYTPWPELIKKINDAMPLDIELSSITGDSSTKEIIITGITPDQKVAATMKKNLEEEKILSNIKVSLTTSRDKLNFQINATHE